MPTVAQYLERLRSCGFKLTPQRHLLCELLAQAVGHPTVEQLYNQARQAMPTLSLKTVYSILADLAQTGSIRLVDLGTGSLRVELNSQQPHAHLVCRVCGRVDDVEGPPWLQEEVPPPLANGHSTPPGFLVEECAVIYRGVCPACQEAAR